jgi:Tfp pilus assembly protein PilV
VSRLHNQDGLTAVELLITLFVAAIFIIAGFSLYGVVVKDNGTTRAQTIASALAYSYLRQYTSYATKPCTAQGPITTTPTVAGLSAVTVSFTANCPYSGYPTTGTGAVPTTVQQSVTELQVTVTYDTPQQTTTNALYVKQ